MEESNYIPASDLSNVKVGDDVYTLFDGWGKVTDIDKSDPYPVKVDFEDGYSDDYMFDGIRCEHDRNPSAWTFNPFAQPSINGNVSISEFQFNVEQWAIDKGLIKPENVYKQLAKTVEELGELSNAIIKSDIPNIEDGIGDVCVTLAIIAKQCGLSFEQCLQSAWNEIKDRKGKSINGVFYKEAVQANSQEKTDN